MSPYTWMIIGAGLLAAAILAVLIRALVKNRRYGQSQAAVADEAIYTLGQAQAGDQLPADAAAAVFATANHEELRLLGGQLARISRHNFEGRLLPEPGSVLDSMGFFRRESLQSSGRLAALVCFGLGTGTLILSLLVSMISNELGRMVPLSLLLFLFSILAALVVLWQTARTASQIGDDRLEVIEALAAYLPVFTDRTGVALLVNEIIGYGEKMRGEVKAFTKVADELAKGEFAEGIKTSVRGIMSEEVAPPLRETNYALTELAKSLADKQEKGMEELADTFSNSVSQALSAHLSPLPDKLQTLYQVAEHSANLMEESKVTLERVREESREVTNDAQETLRLMALAKNDMADEMAAISDNLAVMGASSEKMAALYAGEESNLASHINRLNEQLRSFSDRLGEGIVESSKAIEASVKMSASQNKNAAILLERLEEQLASLEDLGRQITDNAINFTKESGGFVTKTLEEFDVSLAEVVERLTFTTAEIRDAIDALPAAIRGGQ